MSQKYLTKLVQVKIILSFSYDASKVDFGSMARQFPAVILTGARQTGKTTILRESFPDYQYISLDLPSDAEQAEEEPQAFLARFKGKVIIDEAQYAPKLFRHLKIAIDQDRTNYGHFLLTGTQKFNLMKEVSDSLAGRCVWLELEGLSLKEILGEEQFEIDLDFIYKLMIRGSLPELWGRSDLSAKDYYRTYLATYLERDVRQILNVASLRDFERFIRVMAIRNGQLLNMSEVSKEVGIALNTVKQWISILEASNQIFLLEPYFSNTGKRVIKSPKVYFSEIGILCYLLGINAENISETPFIGNIWESLVCSEFRKKIKNIGLQAKLWFYRDNRDREVDFIFEHEGQLDLFEVKWTSTIKNISTKSLDSVYNDMVANKKQLLSIGKRHVISRISSDITVNDVQYINLGSLHAIF